MHLRFKIFPSIYETNTFHVRNNVISYNRAEERNFRLLTEKIFVLNLIPYKLDESKRMRILVNVFLNTNNYGAKLVYITV